MDGNDCGHFDGWAETCMDVAQVSTWKPRADVVVDVRQETLDRHIRFSVRTDV